MVEPRRDDEVAQFAEYVADRDVQCPFCSVNLRGIATARCPQCGANLDVEILRDGPNRGVQQVISEGASDEPVGWVGAVILGLLFLAAIVVIVIALVRR